MDLYRPRTGAGCGKNISSLISENDVQAVGKFDRGMRLWGFYRSMTKSTIAGKSRWGERPISLSLFRQVKCGIRGGKVKAGFLLQGHSSTRSRRRLPGFHNIKKLTVLSEHPPLSQLPSHRYPSPRKHKGNALHLSVPTRAWRHQHHPTQKRARS